MSGLMTVAVLGCGAVVEQLYLRPLRMLESRGFARVVAFADPNLARASALARGFAAARTYGAVGDAIAARAELVVVASPPALHAEHAIAALESGSHVLCEKPLATSAADGERMRDAARHARRVLALGMLRRFFPSYVGARELIASGVLGGDLTFTYREGGVYSWPVRSDAPFRRETAGGGVLIDLGSHVLDSLAALFGELAVRAYTDDALARGVETNCVVDLRAGAASGVAQLSWSQPLATKLAVSGSRGELVLHPGRLEPGRWRRHGEPWPGRAAAPASAGRAPRSIGDCIFLQLLQTIRAAQGGDRPAAGAADGVAVARAIEACYRQAAPLVMPWLEAKEQESATARHWSLERCAA